MNRYGYVEVSVSREFVATHPAPRREVRRQARLTLAEERLPQSPIIWRITPDEDGVRFTVRGFVGRDRIVGADLVRNRRRWPELSSASPCWSCGLPGLRMARIASAPLVAALLPGDDPVPIATVDACPRHRRPLLRLAATYRRDPRVRG
jgi:hypothetical protein